MKLLEKELVEIKGKSEAIGRPMLYGTSEKFMFRFRSDFQSSNQYDCTNYGFDEQGNTYVAVYHTSQQSFGGIVTPAGVNIVKINDQGIVESNVNVQTNSVSSIQSLVVVSEDTYYLSYESYYSGRTSY